MSLVFCYAVASLIFVVICQLALLHLYVGVELGSLIQMALVVFEERVFIASYYPYYFPMALFLFLIPFLPFYPLIRPGSEGARFATVFDLLFRKMIFHKQSLLLGKYKNCFVGVSQHEHAHVLVSAPTGSGKGVGLVIPNCLHWRGSLVVLDIKGENLAITGRDRAERGNVYVFNPMDSTGKTQAYNPFHAIGLDDDISRNKSLAIRYSEIILPNPEGSDPIWSTQGRTLISSVVLFIAEHDYPVTGYKVHRVLSGDVVTRLVNMAELSSGSLKDAFLSFVNMPDRTFGSVLSTAQTAVSVFAIPSVANSTSGTSWDWREFREGSTSLFLVIQPNDIAALKPLIRLLIEDMVSSFIDMGVVEHSASNHTLLLLDEFSSIGRMELLAQSISYVRGYGLRYFIVLQTLAQLDSSYGRHRADEIVSNCKVSVAFSTNSTDQASVFSKKVGDVEKERKSVTRGRSKSVTVSTQKKALLEPYQIQNLGTKQALLFVESMPAVLVEKIAYYRDRSFYGRYDSLSSPFAMEFEHLPGSETESFRDLLMSLDKPADEPHSGSPLTIDELDDALDTEEFDEEED